MDKEEALHYMHHNSPRLDSDEQVDMVNGKEKSESDYLEKA